MTTRNATDALTGLGLTELEAEVYVYLLRHPPATGYRVAKGVGRTNAVTYKALDSLQAKGAILVDEGENRVCRAVPVTELLGRLRRRLDAAYSRAEKALAGLRPAGADDRVYRLRSRGQVLERARRMLADARYVALVDAYPGTAAELREAIAATAGRGLHTHAKVYAPVDLGAADVVVRERGHEIVDRSPGDHLEVNVDGREYLVASLRRDGGEPWHAIWTSSAILAYQGYGSMIYELILTDVQQAIRGGAGNRKLGAILDHYAHLHPISSRSPVYFDHLEALGLPVPAEAARPAKETRK